jgi:vacuolar-type H+-ATPase subunit I/STV1
LYQSVDAYAKVHRKALEKEQKYMEKLREATAKHDEAYNEEQRELQELNNRKAKLAEMEEIVATKKSVISKLTQMVSGLRVCLRRIRILNILGIITSLALGEQRRSWCYQFSYLTYRYLRSQFSHSSYRGTQSRFSRHHGCRH